ncbi:YihY/virulence factor BrkB family protein [Sphingomicrobium astaxanthinifaciens]|uniref:YihY/virulence factor BrkB family protein n=1 Tax=Sphingomicrobium astaxanthinifaciens TaxID=1227949 RepID=UPI001FCBB795|nr:YihY/virulence factor BrkB family protein [Sphingomicrobium astaxanthinifaciens]MCJ7420826.1 YihY/virulence factor BrkB family protein [Sphingomicrobium astaxanthinifaciens]
MRDSDRPWEVTKRVVIGVYSDGFIHAGNLAYISMLAIFPFIILATAVAVLLGEGGASEGAILTVLSRLPPNVAEALAGPLFEVSARRPGPLLWFGALVGLWTTGSYIETIRDVLRRAYGVRMVAPFWEYRLASIGLIVGSVFLLMIAFASSLTLSSVQALIETWFPVTREGAGLIALLRIVPALTLYVTIYLVIWALTPLRYRKKSCRIWPGALAITLWWLVTVALLPEAVQLFGGYGRTYGSLAGAMVALIFFYIIGFGVVIGAELNAALASSGDKALKGERYSGPHADELEVEDPGEDEAADEDEPIDEGIK